MKHFIGHGKLKWWRIAPNVGYMRLGSTAAIRHWTEFLQKDSEKYKSIYRIFHTKHLMIVWETEGKAA